MTNPLRRFPAIRLLLLTSGLAAWTGCTRPAPAAEDANTLARRAAFDSASAALHDALRTGDAERFLASVTDDVQVMPPGEPVIRGKDALRAWTTAFLSQYRTTSLTLADREVFLTDSLGVEVGTYEWGITPVAGGRTTLDHGNYFQIWRLQPDGQWLFAREIWNRMPPAPGPAVQ